MSISRRQFLAGAGAATVAGAAGLLPGTASASTVLGNAARFRYQGSQQPVTLSLWHSHPEWAQQINALVSQFEKQHPAIKIDVTAKSGVDYPTLLTSALAAGSAPNIFGCQAGAGFQVIAKAGHLRNLTGKVNVAALNAAATSVMPVNGKIYAVPLLGEYTTGIYYWKPVFAKYKLTPPTTWSELINVCETLLKAGQSPIQMASSDGTLPSFWWTGLMTTVRGPNVITELASGKTSVTDADLVAATTYLQSLVPYFAQGFASTAYYTGKALFASGKGAMIMGGSADYTGYKNVNPKVDLGFFAFPHSDHGGVAAVNSGVDLLYGLNSNVTDPASIAAAETFFNFFLTSKVSSEVAQNIEMPDTKQAHVTAPIFEQIIQQSTNNGPEWYEVPQLTPLWSYSLANIENMFLGKLSPSAFAAAAQATIKV